MNGYSLKGDQSHLKVLFTSLLKVCNWGGGGGVGGGGWGEVCWGHCQTCTSSRLRQEINDIFRYVVVIASEFWYSQTLLQHMQLMSHTSSCDVKYLI